jgi:hypothetical protein
MLCGETAAGCEVTVDVDALHDVDVPTIFYVSQFYFVYLPHFICTVTLVSTFLNTD